MAEVVYGSEEGLLEIKHQKDLHNSTLFYFIRDQNLNRCLIAAKSFV